MYINRMIRAAMFSFAPTVLVFAMTSNVDAALSFKAANSSVVFTHNVNESGGPSRTANISGAMIPAGPGATFPLADDTLTESFGANGDVDSRARAGFGHITSPFTGSGTVKSGTLITQVDLDNNSDEFSTLSIDFDLKWDVTPPRFGPPIIGAFNVPVLAVVGSGGQAKAEIIDFHWQKDTGGVITDLRAPANVSVNFASGATLSALSVPPAVFSPFLLTPADDLLVNGTVKFSTKNANSPVFFYPELPNVSELAADTNAFVHLAFNEQAPGNVAGGPVIDSISGLQVGTYAGNPTHVSGIPNDVNNSAANFGSTDFAQVIFPTFQSFTVETFIAANAATFMGNGTIVGEADDDSFLIRSINGTNQIEAIVFDSSGNPLSLGPVAVPGLLTDFHHIAFSYDDDLDLAQLFIDGNLVASDLPVGVFNRNGGFSVVSNIGQDFNGVIDEILYYDFAKDPAFIQAVNLLGQTDPDSFDRIIGAVAGDAIPEPTTALLAVMGVASLAGRRRRRDLNVA